MTFTLRDDQIEDLAYLIKNPKVILGNEPGTGKTPTVCVYQRHLWNTQKMGTIWVQPKSLLNKNRKEAYRFGQWENEDDVVIVDGTPDQVDDILKKPAKVWLMGFRRFQMLQDEGRLPDNARAFISDEHHKGFGGHESQQTGAMYDFMRGPGEIFVPMTGTIINGKLDTAYPAIQVISPEYYGTFKAFQNYHHINDMFTGKRIGFRNHAFLREILEYHGTYRKWSSIFGKRNVVFQVEYCDMESEQWSIYREFEKNALVELDKFFIDGSLPGVAFIRARQILDHPNQFPDLSDPEGRKFVDIIPGKRSGKLERIDLHLTDHAENGTPVVIFASLVPQQLEILRLAQSMGMKFGLLNGGVSAVNRAIQDEAFQAGELQGLVVSSDVADVGFNWQFWGPNKVEVSHCIFASLPYLDTTMFQAYCRFIRETRKQPLRVTVLKYNDSRVEYRMSEIIRDKSANAKLVDPTLDLIDLTG